MLSLAIAATWLSTSCPTLPADPSTWLPDSTTLVAGVDVDGALATSLGAALVRGLEGDLVVGEALELLAECGLALAQVDEAWLARDAGEGRLLIVEADALAEPDTLACVEAKLRAREGGEAPWTTQRSDTCTTLELPDGARAWLAGDRLIAARGPMIAGIEQPSATPSELLDAIDRSGHAWLAARLDRPRWAVEARSLQLALALARQGRPGLSLSFTMQADDIASAATLRDRVLGLLAGFADRLDALGIEHRVRERAGVAVAGSSITGELELDARELERIHAVIEGASLL